MARNGGITPAKVLYGLPAIMMLALTLDKALNFQLVTMNQWEYVLVLGVGAILMLTYQRAKKGLNLVGRVAGIAGILIGVLGIFMTETLMSLPEWVIPVAYLAMAVVFIMKIAGPRVG